MSHKIDYYASGYADFLKTQRALLQESVDILGKRVGKILTTQEGLGEVLVSIDPMEIRRLSIDPFTELIDNEEHELMTEISIRQKVTQMWLYSIGWKVLAPKYTVEELIWLDNFREYYQESITSYSKDSPERPHFVPSMLDWSVYLTIRGSVPSSFPEDGLFMYALKRWLDFIQGCEEHGIDLDKWDETTKATLLPILGQKYRHAQIAKAKREGTWEDQKREQTERRKKARELVEKVYRLQEKGIEVTLVPS